MPPCTTKRRTTENLKTKNNQNCQKIKLYGSPTTKELKKKHSFRQGGGAEKGSREERTRIKVVTGGQGGQGGGRWSRWSHIYVWINWEEQLRSKTSKPRVPAPGNKASKPLTIKTCGSCCSGRNSQHHSRVRWRDPITYTNPPTGESAPEWPNPLVGSRGSD